MDIFFAFCLDVRMVDVKMRILEDHTTDTFLNEFIVNVVGMEHGEAFTKQYGLFKKGQGVYKLDRFMDGNKKRYTPNQPWEFNKVYWEKLMLRFESNEHAMLLARHAYRYCQRMSGIEAVESSFSAIKDIYRQKRGALGPAKTRKLLYVKNNYNMLKRFENQ